MSAKPIEEALHEQTEWLRATLSSIGDAVITTDANGGVTFLNPVAQSLTGWTLDHAAGLPLEKVFAIVNEDTRKPVENPVTRALRDGAVVGLANHTLLISRDGTERPIDDSASPIRNTSGQLVGVVLVFRDVTERRRAEHALRQSEQRFRLMVEAVQDYAIFMLDPKGNIAGWNAGAQRIKGYSAEEIIGKHFSCFYPKGIAEAGWPAEELRRAAAEGRFEDEGWRVRKDDTTFWANVVITALRDEAGNLIGYTKITRDLTQRRQLERARAETEAMADLNRRKDEFLAMLSHEIRNPLAPVLNAIHLLRLQKETDIVQQQAREIIERQVAHLVRIVDDLLEVSRITTGRIRLQREHIDLRAVVDHAVEAVRPALQRRRQEFAVAKSKKPVWLHGDAARIEQVIVNLLNNASKYTPEGGRIWVTVQQESDDAVLRVRDNGVGITADLLSRIFDLFAQADRSLDRSQGGLGVGLTVVQRLVELHGGKVQASSEGLGKGSEFVVRLPVAAPSSGHDHSKAGSASNQSSRALRLLMVDDNKDAADTAALLLRDWGHDVHVAYSGSEALQASLTFQPNAILLDIGLPGMDGYEVARRLREMPQFKHACIMALSGYGQENDLERSKLAGFDLHLVKPVRMEKVQEFLTTFIQKQQQENPA
jgi:PAS domain S-box-containing protein